MNIFFGKISQNFDPAQIEKGYYISNKGSSWFGELNLGDYVYMIGGGKIQLWKAKNWIDKTEEQEERLNFEIIFDDTNLKVKDLVAFKYFKLSMNLVVKSTRSTASEKKAFFKLEYENSLTEDKVLNKNTYLNPQNFRHIKSLHPDQIAELDSYDIQIQYENKKLKLFPIKNCDPEIISRFKDNISFIGKGRPIKDRTLKIVNDFKNIGKIFDFTIPNFFDAFLCDYNAKTEANLNEKEKINIKSLNVSNKVNNSMHLNQILYGPPGTGKTHKLQNEFFQKFTIKASSLSRDQFLENLVSELSWWQVISIALFDLETAKVNEIYDHELIRIKEKLSSSNTVRPTIWGQLQRHTILSCPYVNVKERSEPLYFSKDKDSNWTIDTELLNQYYPEALDILESIQNFTGNEGIIIKNYDFVTFHQSFSYEDFIEGIKPKLEDGETELSFEIKDGIFKKLCLKAEADPDSNYAIFIDEINRGNISAIFGELITLIEDDKRVGAKNELKIKLPYSKREFGVPSNLYIIGTMNTADRSVEALDTALRRRFCFVEMMPDPKVVASKNFSDYDRVKIMEKINQRIELLLDRNYTLGHSYFIKDNFENSFKNEIIPLLQEYFYNDCGKIGLILGKGFVREKEISKNNNTSIFADFDTQNEVSTIKSYELIPFNKIDFTTAIITLLM